MNQGPTANTVVLLNNSSEVPILLSLTKVEDINEPTPNKNTVSPKSKTQRNIEGGVMNLFVWSEEDKKIIWKGIIPTKITKEIVIHPEEKKVTFNGVVIPKDFLPVTSFESDGMEINKPKKCINWKFGIIVIICVILLFILYFTFKIEKS